MVDESLASFSLLALYELLAWLCSPLLFAYAIRWLRNGQLLHSQIQRGGFDSIVASFT